jgi:hypothetical protein
LTKARSQLDRGNHEDDPLYLQFVTSTEATGIEGLSRLALAQPQRAVRAFRTVTETPDNTYRRNQGYYTVQLAEATRRHGDVSGASEIALNALPTIANLRSRRTRRLFDSFRVEMGGHTSTASRNFVGAYDQAVGR